MLQNAPLPIEYAKVNPRRKKKLAPAMKKKGGKLTKPWPPANIPSRAPQSQKKKPRSCTDCGSGPEKEKEEEKAGGGGGHGNEEKIK